MKRSLWKCVLCVGLTGLLLVMPLAVSAAEACGDYVAPAPFSIIEIDEVQD